MKRNILLIPLAIIGLFLTTRAHAQASGYNYWFRSLDSTASYFVEHWFGNSNAVNPWIFVNDPAVGGAAQCDIASGLKFVSGSGAGKGLQIDYSVFPTVALTGDYNDLSNKPTGANASAYLAGSAYTLTATSSAVTGGTTNPTITIPATGTYLISPVAQLRYVGATFLTNRNITLKLRRTNNTAADLANSSTTFQTQVISLLSFTAGTVSLPAVIYSGTAGDVITIYAGIDTLPTAGSIQCNEASLVAVKI